jgi:hypothetical protein
LLPHRLFDHAIDILPGKEPPCGPFNGLSEKELSELKEYIKELLNQEKTCPSKSPAGAPTVFVTKLHASGQ